jgi:hypothetical protein
MHDDDNDDYTVESTTGEYGDDGMGDVELGDGTDVENPNLTTQPPRPTYSPAPSPSSGESTKVWYQKTSFQYESFLQGMLQEQESIDGSNLASLFCESQDMILCGYDDYCPDGQGYDPHPGGPADLQMYWDNALEESQWAPYSYRTSLGSSVVNGGDWVQVGTISEMDGGGPETNYGRCYTYANMNANPNMISADIEESVAEDHMEWILCCQDR